MVEQSLVLPQHFTHPLPTLFGHAEVAAQLNKFISEQSIPHGLLFYGPQGVGKRLVAEHFAWALICGLAKNGTSGANVGLQYDETSPLVPVLSHGAYRGYASIEKDGSLIKVQQIRLLSNKLVMADEGWRVIIVDAADDLNTAAANALLKTLEEPLGQTVLVLICHNLANLLPTLISRCRKVRFGNLSEEEIKGVLTHHGKAGFQSAQKGFLQFADGSAGKALQFLEEGQQELFDDITNHLAGKKQTTADDLLKKSPQFALLAEALLWSIARQGQAYAQSGKVANAYTWGTLYQKVQRILLDQQEFNLTPQLALEQVLGHINKEVLY